MPPLVVREWARRYEIYTVLHLRWGGVLLGQPAAAAAALGFAIQGHVALTLVFTFLLWVFLGLMWWGKSRLNTMLQDLQNLLPYMEGWIGEQKRLQGPPSD